MGYSPWGHKELDTNEWLTLCSLTEMCSRTGIVCVLSRSVGSDSLQSCGL